MKETVSLQQTTNKDGLKIVVVGLGHTGTLVVNHLISNEALKGVKFATIDRDTKLSLAPHTVTIAKRRGIEFGQITPQIIEKHALKHYDDIKELLTKFD